MDTTPKTTTITQFGPGAAGLRAPKLRSSCDSCGTAKVKCDRKQPECCRCTKLGLVCIYGLSRQFGKPTRKRPAKCPEAAARFKKRAAHVDEIYSVPTVLDYAQIQSLNEPRRLESSITSSEMPSSAPGLTNTLRMDEQYQFSSEFLTPSFLNDWPQLDSFGLDIEIPLFPNSSSTVTRPKAPALDRDHSCPRESYEILRDLICLSPDLHAPEADSGPVSAQLDQVLRCTRNAIDRLTRLLGCPCARSGHRVMVHASIISRILLWYQQAVGWTCIDTRSLQPFELVNSSSSSSESPSSLAPYQTLVGSDTASTPSTPTLAESTGFIVENVPVSMGSFSIEDQNLQAALRDQLVLSELKRAGILIHLFSGTSKDTCEASSRGMDLHTHLGAWLQSEHSRTIRVLTMRISALN
jgi:hypothetical protein